MLLEAVSFREASAFLFTMAALTLSCCARTSDRVQAPRSTSVPRVILDTDANNELDDQHAIAYLVMNAGSWTVEGITTNTTANGGAISAHTAEALRVLQLCGASTKVKVYPGANGAFDEIRGRIAEADYDGRQSVDFILEQSRRAGKGRLVLLAVGKLTNVALALLVDPSLADRASVLWLGSHWPRPGEYNLDNDVAAASYVIESRIPLDIAVVREGEPSGTGAVKVSVDEIRKRMPGLGPKVAPVTGRHGGSFSNFGDYSISLFENIGNKQRSLYDMAAVAVLKNPTWATWTTMPAPRLANDGWTASPENPRKLRFITDFSAQEIVADLFATLSHPQLP